MSEANKLLTVVNNSSVPFQQNNKNPDDDDEEKRRIISSASSALDSLDLVNRLQALFPRHDVRSEFDKYWRGAKQKGFSPNRVAFAKWMLRAEIPLTRLPRISAVIPLREAMSVDGTCAIDDHPNLFDECDHKRFVRQYAERKARKA